MEKRSLVILGKLSQSPYGPNIRRSLAIEELSFNELLFSIKEVLLIGQFLQDGKLYSVSERTIHRKDVRRRRVLQSPSSSKE